MPHRPFEGQNCSVAGALSVLGERWTLLVMREILLGRRHFREIRRHTGVAANILSDRLQTLVDQGLLERRGTEYVPTRKGVDVNPVLVALMQWGDRHAAGEAGPPRVVVHTACGHDADPALRCAHCDEEIDARDLQVRPGPGASAEQRGEPILPAR
ncbi:MAG TPA: helix-turn-helix domain-containing protein [Solirubrobacteraceae bacterium]|jgi:DNA-binding HxlR family transcriptional regulator|nr:helix-turn-helix domain-containing protein [Solirubrobacteraceae bacterium]